MDDETIYSSHYGNFTRDEIKQMPYIDEGSCAIVHKFKGSNDKIIKLVKNDIMLDYVNIGLLYRINNLKLSNFFRLYDVLYNETYRGKLYRGVISKYYEKENIDITTMPSSWVTDNYEALRDNVITLGENNIMAYDLASQNVILKEDQMTVIDTDLYSRSRGNCVEENIDQLNRYVFFELLYNKYIEKYNLSERELLVLRLALQQLFEKKKDGNKFVKTLSKYPRPIDFLDESINRR